MSAGESFNGAASISTGGGLIRGSRRPATRPLSFRLTEDEPIRLVGEANGAPLGAYVKAKLLGSPLPRVRRSNLAIEDRQALAKALALLGRSRLASNLNQIARLAHIGALPFTDEIGAELYEAAGDVRTKRNYLLRALGLSIAP